TSSDAAPAGTCPIVVVRRSAERRVCDNFSTVQQRIEIEDTTVPTITGTIPTLPVEGCTITDLPTATNTLAYLRGLGVTITDACGDAGLTVTSSDAAPAGTCPIVVVRTYTVTDDCDNFSTVQQRIEVQKSTRPTFSHTNPTLPVDGCTITDSPTATNTV